ncbi:hypothetical protein C8Q79DRAFT_898503 [Trametes meyenii]|nr:hypothetical protein C8Q79DRAFT_898503 [Trametes meyenii]
MASVHNILEELHLIACSLLPGETLRFTEDPSGWAALLEAYSANPGMELTSAVHHPAHFQVSASGDDVWFDIELPLEYGVERRAPLVAVKGHHLGRTEQEQWQTTVVEALEEVRGSEYPLYELISTHLLPHIHEASERASATPAVTATGLTAQAPKETSLRYHALFTSHHLKSPQKRRSLSQWSHELMLTGFAKIGHPGVIYCEGVQEDVEEFISRVKGMQWLALRLRFIEPAPSDNDRPRERKWTEFERTGEVVEEMKRQGREHFVVEMGIGSAGNGRTN